MVHLSVQKYSADFKAIYKRSNYSTPKNYLDFINNYIAFLKGKRRSFDAMVRRLEGGLATLAKATADTTALSKVLAEKNKVIGEKAVVVNAAIAEIAEKSEVAGVKAKAAAAKKAELAEQAVIIEREDAAATKALEAAIPALQEAENAVADINKPAITEIQNLPQPPDVIREVCSIAFFLYPNLGADVAWLNIKAKLLGDP